MRARQEAAQQRTASGARRHLVGVLARQGHPVPTDAEAPVWVPSVNARPDGTPRFMVTSSDVLSLAIAAEQEYGAHGVDVELRLFLDEALANGDAFVDAAPRLGFAALTAATHGADVAVHTLHADAASADALHRAAAHTATSIATVVTDSVDAVSLPTLDPTAYVILHAGHVAAVPAVLAGAREALQRGLIGAIAWQCSHAPEDAAATQTTQAVLDVLGFAPFVLADGADGMELVPAAGVTSNQYTFSLSEAFIARTARATGTAASAVPVTTPDGYTAGAVLETHARALFEAIAEDLSPGARALGRAPTRGELATAHKQMHLRHARVVSFDVFDTLVTRRVATPTDVFLLLAARAPFAAASLDALHLATQREQAERDARRRSADTRGTGEVTLADIHAVLAEMLGWGSEQVPAMVSAEQALELDLCQAHPTIQAWFRDARQAGKTLWCLSDTYHDAAFLTRLLTHCGYDMQDVLVVASCEARCSKYEGLLFERVLAAQRVLPGDVLHIGDHSESDDAAPAARGLRTVLHPWPAARDSDLAPTDRGDALALGIAARAARCHEPAPPFWWRFGYSVAGPLLSGFALWLADRFRADGIDRAYFLLRDGEILLDVYRTVAGSRAAVPTALLESSRRAFALPAYEAQRSSLLAQLTVSENPRPVREFFQRWGLSVHAFFAEIAAHGFASADEIVRPDDHAARTALAQLLRTPKVAAALRERSRQERDLLLTYLDQEGVLAGGTAAFVDVGWNATIQRSLVAALDTAGRRQTIHGYYLGTLSQAHTGTGAGTARGYLFESSQPVMRTRAVMRLPQLLEFVCSTTRGSLKHFVREGGQVVPVHSAVDHDDAQQAAHHELRRGVMAYASELAEACRTFDIAAISPDAALRRLARVVEHPTYEEASHIGAIRHGDGLGADRSHALAQFPADAWSVRDIHRARTAAYWPAGLAAQRHPQALILRTLQWLAEDRDG